MRKAFGWLVVATLAAVVIGFGWLLYGEFRTTEAVHFDASIDVVNHQSVNVGKTLTDTGTFVDTEISKISDISTLVDEWTPRYDGARSAYAKFDAAIMAAEQQAEAYFASQRALTDRYHDPQRQAQAQASDDADYSVYAQWLEQAHIVRAHAGEITKRLDDMDTDLRKLTLSVGFSFDSSKFEAVPYDILVLDDELTEFRIASENIREITKSPFENR